MPLTLLVDNGSLEPAAVFALRQLAAQLTSRLGVPVEPVSLLHASAIDPKELDGQPAEILFPALERRLAAGQHDFIILPLFFGPSRALTAYLPENLARLQMKHPRLRVQTVSALHDPADDRLARILADRVQAVRAPDGTDRVALVDHGSPVAAVTAVRDDLARQLTARLGSTVAAVAPCSMERRPEPAYDFNDPTLAALLATTPWNQGRVIVALQFLLPGRHAGVGGDVDRICGQAREKNPGLSTVLTAPVGDHPLLLEILADRWKLAARPR